MQRKSSDEVAIGIAGKMSDEVESSSDESTEVEMSEAEELIQQMKDLNDATVGLLDTIQDKAEMLDKDKADEFYASLNNDVKVQNIFQLHETRVSEICKQFRQLGSDYDLISVVAIDRQAWDALVRDMPRMQKEIWQIKRRCDVAEVRVATKRVADPTYPNIQPTVTFVSKAESVDNINRMFAKPRAERNETALDLEEVQNNSCDFGVTAQL